MQKLMTKKEIKKSLKNATENHKNINFIISK
ncbi:Hypothetical Protein SLY_0865 [Strawberry lethal yellows phytoplasma (CPA) str. NZSb11]|uniref:Uncharacterized protein n=1 Tax=Strawberry lethal yellows phytoplasma (CPA) str. NZSb11 TaxID=980422 RepID=R4RN44_PHYAS|nr:Hypothetical Protein SLY_0865 [Strawberry lethal yellows phytoplasma (CPA) str. NZSb11]